MKNLLKNTSIVLLVCIILSFAISENVFASSSNVVIAQPNNSSVIVNGRKIDFESYNINGNNYFKLRDIAMALNSSEKSFDITWNAVINAIVMTKNMAYTPVGGELKQAENFTQKEAKASTTKFYLNDQEVSLESYNIGGNNYIKLRDIGKTIDFNVDWNANLRTITLNTALGYGPIEPSSPIAPVKPIEPTKPVKPTVWCN